MLLLLSAATTGCKKDNSEPEENEETTTNDPRLLGKWSNTSSLGPNSALISTYDFKSGQIVDAMLASSGTMGVSVISNFRLKWTTANNNTVTIQGTGTTSTEKYVVDGKKLLFTSADNKQTEYTKVD